MGLLEMGFFLLLSSTTGFIFVQFLRGLFAQLFHLEIFFLSVLWQMLQTITNILYFLGRFCQFRSFGVIHRIHFIGKMSFLTLRGLFERLRAPSQSQKGHFSEKTKLKKWHQNSWHWQKSAQSSEIFVTSRSICQSVGVSSRKGEHLPFWTKMVRTKKSLTYAFYIYPVLFTVRAHFIPSCALKHPCIFSEKKIDLLNGLHFGFVD